jgi:hypothetical protein
MISNEFTQFALRALAADAAAVAAAQAALDEQHRRFTAQESYTTAELHELVDLALAEGSDSLAWDFAWAIVHRDSSYVLLNGWNFRRPVMLRPADVPATVITITGCVCDGGTCHHCTCCELWNGEHSCMWDEKHQDEDDFDPSFDRETVMS